MRACDIAAARRRLQVAALRKQGYKLREIAAVYGVSESLICKDLKRSPVQNRPKSVQSDNLDSLPEIHHIPTAKQMVVAERRQQAMEWRKQGYMLKDIAAVYGVSQALICKDLKRMEREERRKQQAREARPALPPLPKRASA